MPRMGEHDAATTRREKGGPILENSVGPRLNEAVSAETRSRSNGPSDSPHR
jgi:hypothetical protein